MVNPEPSFSHRPFTEQASFDIQDSPAQRDFHDFIVDAKLDADILNVPVAGVDAVQHVLRVRFAARRYLLAALTKNFWWVISESNRGPMD